MIDVKLFQFDSQSDYLPYYKTFLKLNINRNDTIFRLLQELKTFDEDYSCPYLDFAVRVNGVYTFTNTKISDILISGHEITLDPVSEYWCAKDLLIDNSAFIKQFNKLKDICDDDDWKFYQNLECDYYASEVLKYNKNYFGDSFFVFVDYMIQKYPQHKEYLVNIIDDKENGIYLWEETKTVVYPNNGQNSTIKQLLENDLGVLIKNSQPLEIPKRLKDLSGFHIAYVSNIHIDNEPYKQKLKEHNANLIDIGYHSAGEYIYQYSKNIAFAKAVEMLDIAQNAGAEYIVVGEGNMYEYLKSNYKKIAKSSPKTIEIPVISLEEISQ